MDVHSPLISWWPNKTGVPALQKEHYQCTFSISPLQNLFMYISCVLKAFCECKNTASEMPHHLDCQLLPSTKQASLYSLKCHVSKKNVTQEKLYSITVKIFTFSYANYHCENTQLATHPIDIVKQCVAVRIQLKRVAHSNEDCRGKKKNTKLNLHLNNV